MTEDFTHRILDNDSIRMADKNSILMHYTIIEDMRIRLKQLENEPPELKGKSEYREEETLRSFLEGTN